MQRNRWRSTHHTGTRAMRAKHSGAFQHARTDALAGHLHQAERRDTAYLNPSTVIFQCIFQPPFNRTVVPVLFHVDEIDHDEASQIAQS